MSDSVDFEHKYETESGEIIPLFISMDFSSYSDHNYGADADGNRGRTQTFLEYEDIVIKLKNDLDVTVLIKMGSSDLYKDLKKEAERLAEDLTSDPEYGCYDNYN